MREHEYCRYEDEDPWEDVQLTKEAIRARATLLLYTVLVTAPFIALVACSGMASGLKGHEVLGVSCYNAMISTIFFFDTLRNAAHDCFDEAQSGGFVTCVDGVPVIDRSYPHRRLARLSFAIRGRAQKRPTP